MKKNNSGFSLVELIVVIAIMAILAGIAVPTYVKYIDEANNAKYINTLDEIKTAAVAAGIKDKGKEVGKIEVTASEGTVSVITITIKGESTGTAVAITSADTYKSFFTLMDITAVNTLKVGDKETTYASGGSWY